MSTAPGALAVIAAVSGAVVAWALALMVVRNPPATLMRENHRGLRVGAVLGAPLVAAGLIGTGLLLTSDLGTARRTAAALALLIAALGLAGLWDDLRGDERPRGFKGHLGAARNLGLTGGLMKMAVGGAAGLGASVLLFDSPVTVLLSAAIVALTANLVNLFDRAPGRAAKVGLMFLAATFLAAPMTWTIGAAGILGGLLAVMPFDLRERGMLGDAGANPLGAVVGLGLALALPDAGRAIAAVALLGVNLASEVWSFSRAIEAVPVLTRLDHLGRRESRLE